MGYILKTKNSQYLVTYSDNPDICFISGGKMLANGMPQFDHLKIYKPSGMISPGLRFKAQFTNDPQNGEFANKILETSVVESVHMLRYQNNLQKEENEYER